MTNLRTAAQQALSWIHYVRREYGMDEPKEERALRAALAQQAEPMREPVALKWLQAPRKTEWGFGMVSADVEIDRDHTLTLYCEDDQTAKVDAMFRRVFCTEEA
jgi:hypothetical protein